MASIQSEFTLAACLGILLGFLNLVLGLFNRYLPYVKHKPKEPVKATGLC